MFLGFHGRCCCPLPGNRKRKNRAGPGALYQREDGLTSCPPLPTHTRKSHTFLQKTSARHRMTRLKNVWCLSRDFCFSLRMNRTMSSTTMREKCTVCFSFHNATTSSCASESLVCFAKFSENEYDSMWTQITRKHQNILLPQRSYCDLPLWLLK